MMKHLTIVLLAALPTTSHGFVTPLSSKASLSTTTTQRHLNNFFNFNKPDEEVKEEEDTFQDAAYDEDDPVEKIFGFFFGKREEEPMGTFFYLCMAFFVARSIFAHNLVTHVKA